MSPGVGCDSTAQDNKVKMGGAIVGLIRLLIFCFTCDLPVLLDNALVYITTTYYNRHVKYIPG